MEKATADQLFDLVLQWADDRGLLTANPAPQYQKLLEEVGELGSALIESANHNETNPEVEADVVDALGDVIVVMTILAAQKGYCIRQALHSAYEEIKGRKGKLINGVFVKEQTND